MATFSFDFDNILTESTAVEDEDQQAVPSSFDFSSSFSPVEDVELEDISVARRIGYGAAQEPMILGSAYRMTKAGVESLFTDKSYSEALRDIEAERQREIDIDFPEFAGLSEAEEDAAIMSGRISSAFVDPVTFLIPWTKVAKAGKIATIGTGAAVGAGETALREKALYGEVDGANVALSAVISGASTGAVDAIARKFSGAKEIAQDIRTPEKILPNEVDVPVVSTVPAPREELSPMRDVIKQYRRNLDTASRARQGEIILTDKSTQADYVRAHNRKLMGLPQSMDVKFTPEVKQALDESVETVAKKSPLSSQQTRDQATLAQKIREKEKINEKISELVQLRKNKSKEQKAEIDKQLSELERAKTKLEQNMMSGVISSAEQKADFNVSVLEDMSKKGTLTESIINKVLFEAARPVGFGLMGGMYGAATMDEDDDAGYLLSTVAAGAALGFAQKRIQRSTALSDVDKQTGQMAINMAGEGFIARNIQRLKYVTASTTATRMNAFGGWNKVIGNRLFNAFGSDVDSVESKTLRRQSDFLGKLYRIASEPEKISFLGKLRKVKDVNYNEIDPRANSLNTVAGEIMRGYQTIDNIAVGYRGLKNDLQALDADDIEAIKVMVPQLEQLRDSVAQRMKDVGIKFEEVDHYGLPQLWNLDAIGDDYGRFVKDLKEAISIQRKNKGQVSPVNDDLVSRAADSISGRTPKLKYGPEGRTLFKYDEDTNSYTFRGAAQFFENERKITDLEATRYMYEKGWINVNAVDALSDYGTKSIKVAEFSDAFGANGEIINLAYREISTAFNNRSKGTKAVEYENIMAKQKAYQKQLVDSIESYWGGYGDSRLYGYDATVPLKAFTTLANTTYLTTVSIASLGDLLQPFINSSFGNAFKTTIGKKTRFSEISNFKYDKSFERELQNYMRASTGGASKFSRRLDAINDAYFTGVLLQKVTQTARNFAYDVGVNRAFELAKKSKLTKQDLKEAQQLGISGDLDNLRQFNTVEQAFGAEAGLSILDKAGRKAADRDAIIPMYGNRLLFSQTNNPGIRAVGQFLSWAQAKSSQMNSMLSRIENGDAKLAFKILAAVPVYGGIQELKQVFNPNYKVEDKDKDSEGYQIINEVGKSMLLSGQFQNFAIDKVLSNYTYNWSRGDGSLAETIAPAYGLLEQMGRDTALVKRNIVDQGDYEGALKIILEDIPGTAQALGWYEKIAGEPLLENRPKGSSGATRRGYDKGGEVMDVPNAPTEPDQRIDKMTGQPYDKQAGTAFVDEEDPLRRLGFGI